MPDDSSPSSDPRLVRENAELRVKLAEYKALDEDLTAKRVFEKSRRYLTMWITIGGLVVMLASFVGYQQIMDYLKNMAKAKIGTLTEQAITNAVEREVAMQVAVTMEKLKPAIMEQVFFRIALANEPRRNVKDVINPELVSGIEHKVRQDWTTEMGPVRDNGQEGSVVGFALAATLQFYVQKATGQQVAISARDIYNEVRAKAGTSNADSGALLKDGIEFLKKTGAVDDNTWPYRAGEFAQRPPASLAQAKRYKITDARAIVTLDQMKQALDSGPAVAGITLFEPGMNPDVARTGVLPKPRPKDRAMGGHAVCVVGYDDDKGMLKFQNSWGAEWGDKGYGYLPYDYFREQSGDCWTFRYAEH